MLERFTDRARRVVVLAQEEAGSLGHHYVGTEHILLALIREGSGIAANTLEVLGVSLEAVRSEVEVAIGRGLHYQAGYKSLTPRAKKVLELGFREALRLGHEWIGTEHILLGLIHEGDGVASRVLIRLGCEATVVRETVIKILSGDVEVSSGQRGQLQKESEQIMAVLLPQAKAEVERLRARHDEVVRLLANPNLQ